MRKLLWLVIFLITIMNKQGNAQSFSFASFAVRDSITKNLVQKIETTVAKPVNALTLNDWKSACWAMELMLYKPKGFKKKIPAIIKNLHQ